MGVRVSGPLCRDPHVLLDADAELDLDLAIMLDLKSFRGSVSEADFPQFQRSLENRKTPWQRISADREDEFRMHFIHGRIFRVLGFLQHHRWKDQSGLDK